MLGSFAIAVLHVLVRPRSQKGKTYLVLATEQAGPRGTGTGGGGREATGSSLFVVGVLQLQRTFFVGSRI